MVEVEGGRQRKKGCTGLSYLTLILQFNHRNGPFLNSTQHENLDLCPWPPPLFLSQGLPPLALTSHHQHRQLLTVLWSCTPPTQARCCHPRTEKTWSGPWHPQQLPAHLQSPRVLSAWVCVLFGRLPEDDAQYGQNQDQNDDQDALSLPGLSL